MGKTITVEIDLDDVLCYTNEYEELTPTESIKETIERQLREGIVDEIQNNYLREFKTQLQNHLLTEIKQECKSEIEKYIPELIKEALTTKYETRDKWGGRTKETSFMEEFVKELQSHMVYEKKSYESDKNTFTKLIDQTIDQLTKQWKKDFDTYVKNEVLKEAYDYDIEKIARAFNVCKNSLLDDKK